MRAAFRRYRWVSRRLYWLDGRHRQQAGSYRGSVFMSGMSERSSEAERVRK